MITTIRDKATTIDLFRRGFYGNSIRQWDTVEELEADSFSGRVVIRGRMLGFQTVYAIEKRKAIVMAQCFSGGLDSYYFNEYVPSPIFNAEIMRSERGLYMYYSNAPAPMKIALAGAPLHAFGLAAKVIVEQVSDQAETIWELLDKFPDHVIEFSCFGQAVGTLSWRTIIWEVRFY